MGIADGRTSPISNTMKNPGFLEQTFGLGAS
jgi:hypothetical protein